MNILDIHIVPVLADNYVFLVRDVETGRVAVVDPAESSRVLEALERLGWEANMILVTHRHADHTDGIPGIKAAFPDCDVYAPFGDAKAIPGFDVGVRDGDDIRLGALVIRVLDVPGHTAHHVAYWFEDGGVVFVGDTLFSLGCGRLFGGTAAQMWASLKKLRALPPETLVFPAHEYTNANADFALSIEADNPDLQARADQVVTQREAGEPTIPTTLASELACNPFLRADVASVQAAVAMVGGDPADVFAEIRRRKDHF